MVTQNEKVVELTIHHVATHRKAGVVNGIQKLDNGKTIAISDVYEFANTRGTMIPETSKAFIKI